MGPCGGKIRIEGSLWKPVSDSTGKLAILYPSGLGRGCSVNGDSSFADGGIGNGNRQHYRGPKPGGSYPADTIVIIPGYTITIPFPALRWEGVG